MTFSCGDVDSVRVDGNTKGVPPTADLKIGEIAGQGWNILRGDVPLPVAIVRESAIAHNSRWMMGILEKRNVAIAPHVKTTMCPQIMKRQLDDGAWALTVATVQQAASGS